MAIKNKDGTVFKLPGPNPVMKTQNAWDLNKVELINMKWKSVTMEDIRENANTRLREYYERPKIQEVEVKPIPHSEVIIPKKKIHSEDKKTQNMIEKRKAIFHCLPVKETFSHKDDLYGDNYTSLEYGEKYQFAGLLVQETDLNLLFWTEEKLKLKSIIFPQTESKRWWKVEKVEPKSGGYLVSNITSDFNPDFSD